MAHDNYEYVKFFFYQFGFQKQNNQSGLLCTIDVHTFNYEQLYEVQKFGQGAWARTLAPRVVLGHRSLARALV